MSALRQRMNEAMVLRGFAERTKETYLACVSGLAKHYGRSPDTLDAAAIQAYLLHLISERKLAYASVNQAVCAIRFLFAVVLGQREVAFDIPMAKVPKRLPQILTREEISRLLAHARDIRARTLLTTTYAAGLRLSEVCNLQLADIESSPERMCLKVRQGKGSKDRYTLLSPRLLDTLRLYWRVARPSHWLFPNRTGNGPLYDKTAQRIYHAARVRRRHRARAAAFIRCAMLLPPICWKPASISTPSSACSAMVNVSTTMRYFHLAQSRLTGTTSPLELLMPTETAA